MLGTPIRRRWHILMLALLTLAMVLPGLASLPVIDRDEARYAQASVQMAESGDLLNIRFQDEARNKKPAGVYWLQTAMIKTFAGGETRKIWAQRLPSVVGAVATILLLYWGGVKMVGRQAAFMGAALLSVSLVFVFEGHIAKTDALLCAMTTAIFASLGRLRGGGGRVDVWVFWAGLGLSIIIKGPIGLALAVLSLGTLWIWERDLRWAKPLLNRGAIAFFFVLWLPWAIAIFVATDGAFFAESLGNDLGGKVVGAQENHGAPPGSHSLAIWLTLWPASLFLLPGLAYAITALRAGGDSKMTRAMRFCVAWALPFWILIEIMPTKLPHYALPVFPALCLMMGAAILAMMQIGGFTKTRIISGVIFFCASAGLIAGLLFVQSEYGEIEAQLLTLVICGMAAVICLIACVSIWTKKIRVGLVATGLAALLLSGGSYGHILPNLESFRTSERLAAEVERIAPDAMPRDVHSPHYAEPSLVYHLGGEINVKGQAADLSRHGIIILDMKKDTSKDETDELMQQANARGMCLLRSTPINGFNYSKGDAVSLVIFRAGPCSD